MPEPENNGGRPRAPLPDLAEITATAQTDLRALKGARLFITGGTGYIGCWLLESLCHANRELGLDIQAVVLSRQPALFRQQCPHLSNDPAITLLQGDVRDFVFAQGRFTHLIHAATDVVAGSTALETFEVTVYGTRRVLEFARELGVHEVLMLSSGAVYGRLPHQINRVCEDYNGSHLLDDPDSAYGLGKMISEWLGNTYSNEYGLACKSARIFAQVGPYLALDAQFAAGNFMRDALQGQPFVIKGDGTPLRSYMYATDLVSWLWAILARGKGGRAYNVGSDKAVSIRELAVAIARVAGLESPDIHVLGQSAQGAAPERYVPDTSRARQELDLSITVPFEEALRRTIAWYRHPLETWKI